MAMLKEICGSRPPSFEGLRFRRCARSLVTGIAIVVGVSACAPPPQGSEVDSDTGLIAFGDVLVGATTTPRPLNIINRGVDDVSVTFPLNRPPQFNDTPPPPNFATVNAGTTQTVDVTFSPDAEGQFTMAYQISVIGGYPSAAFPLPIRGRGVYQTNSGDFSFAGTGLQGALDFGDVLVFTSKTLQFPVWNRSGTTLPIQVAWLGGNPPFALGAAAPATIGPSATLNLDVNFSPPAVGPFRGALEVRSGAAHHAAATTLGNGVAQMSGGALSFVHDQNTIQAGDLMDFGQVLVGDMKVLRFRVRNTGPDTLRTALTWLTPDPAFHAFVPNPGLQNIPAGAERTFHFAFAPTAVGVRQAAVEIRVGANFAAVAMVGVGIEG